jgi:hypothetical protein
MALNCHRISVAQNTITLEALKGRKAGQSELRATQAEEACETIRAIDAQKLAPM